MDRILLLVVAVASLLAIAPRLDLFRSPKPANPITTGSLPAPVSTEANAPPAPPLVPPIETAARQTEPPAQPPVAQTPAQIVAPSQMPPPPVLASPALESTPPVAAIPQSAPAASQQQPVHTQAPAPVPVAAPVPIAKPAPPAPPLPLPGMAPQVAMPDPDRILLLVRTALLTLNDAMRTGNYTVLRDIGGPYFKDAHSAARLSQIFAPLASQNLDLSMVAVLTPVYSEAPQLDVRNTLRIRGHFPGRPVQLAFDILYEPINGYWRLYALTAGAQAVPHEPVVNRPTGSREPAAKTAGRQ